MVYLRTVSILALAISTSAAHPHRASSGAIAHLYSPSTPTSTPAASDAPVKGYPKPQEHTATVDPAGKDLLGSLSGGLPGLDNRDLDVECSTALTVTTRLQVTVTVTADNYEAGGTAAPGSDLVEQKQVYTTSVAIATSHSWHHGHHHGSGVGSGMPSGTSASALHPSSGIRPASAVSSRMAHVKPKSSPVSFDSSNSASDVLSTAAYTLPTVLPEYPSIAAQLSSPPAVLQTSTLDLTTAMTPATTYTSAGDKGHEPSYTPQNSPTKSTSTEAITTASSAQPAQPSSGYSSGRGKRGLAYNDASLTQGFASSPEISWAYNWGSSTSGLANGLMFIPTLWGTSASFTTNWQSNAQKAIASGSTHLFSFNEPDLSSQSNLSPDAAATAYKKYMSDMFGGGSTKLCAPAVTNGGDATGLGWLKSFLTACSSCQIDCINIHWYGNAESDFEQHVKDAIAVAGGKELWISEFALNGSPSASTVQTFLQSSMSFLDGNDAVTGYAYFMAGQGRLVDGGSPSNPVGTTYMA